MRSILFSLTLVFFTGCLTEATPTDQVDNPDEVAAVTGDDVLDSTVEISASFDPAEAAAKAHALEESATMQVEHRRNTVHGPVGSSNEPDCRLNRDELLDLRCFGIEHER